METPGFSRPLPAGLVFRGRQPSARGAAIGRLIGTVLWRIGYRIRVHGSHHVPKSGPVIIASNHTGIFDGPLLFGVSPRPVHALTKEEVFIGPVGAVLRWVGQIPVNRTAVDYHAIKMALGVLAAGRVLVIYPEGTRRTGDFSEIRGGAAWFALRSGAPIVPLACFGSRRTGQSVSIPPRLGTRLDVVFGAPFAVEPSEPWGPRLPRRVVSKVTDDIQSHLLDHLENAMELTGRSLPGDPGN